MFVSIDLVYPKEKILSFAQKFVKNLVDPFQLFLDIFYVRKNEKKKGQNFFFNGRVAFCFSKHCVLNNLLGPQKRLLKVPQ